MGGLGFREFGCSTLLFRDTLCYKVLSAKYFPDGHVFHLKSMDKPSYTWQSIAKDASVLYEGFGWTVGNGKSIKMWHDNWGFEGLLGNSISLYKLLVKEEKVCDLLKERKDGWDKKRVLEVYGENIGDQICNIPILHNGPEDQRIWFHNLTMCFLQSLLICG